MPTRGAKHGNSYWPPTHRARWHFSAFISAHRRCLLALAYALATVGFVSLVVYASPAPRGSDQFWYLSDTLTLVNGEPPLTNCVFPGPLVRGEASGWRFYFVHHTLVLYVVLPFARLLGAYHAWIVFNILVVVATATIIALTLRRLVGPAVAVGAYGVFLFLPLTIWQASNPLQEAALALPAALIVSLYTFTESGTAAWIAALAISCIAVLCHPLFFPIACVLPVLFLLQDNRWRKPAYVLLGACVLSVAVLFQAKKDAWLPSSFQPSLASIVVGTIPGDGNMEWHFRGPLREITPGLILAKAWDALWRQVPLSATGVFFWPANAMIVGSLILAFRHREARVRRLARATGLLLALFEVMVIVHQNQYRYLLIVTPAILIASAVECSSTFPNALRSSAVCALGFALILVLFMTDAAIARQLRSQGLALADVIATTRLRAADLTDEQRVVIKGDSVGEMLPLTYALYPRLCLLLLDERLRAEVETDLVERFNPALILCRPNCDLVDALGAKWRKAERAIEGSGFAVYYPP